MTQSNLIRTLIALAFGATAFASTAARADTFESELIYRTSPQSSLTRAEVLADLRVYQESGLAEAERVASELGQETSDLRVARQRYAELRNGQRYATLVVQIAQRANEQARQSRGG